ncbi:helix-turn-helix domain-containing protein [Terriglobus aquaticus]|uniref:Helix-turn-helix domain-containing protein n=1 Tax=Terriglobus aquaticus TaxID=940139 RepID=A0ABW9KFF0_9BACT|nr:cupin domain-containing protein [Terriglobus aquaticus]
MPEVNQISLVKALETDPQLATVAAAIPPPAPDTESVSLAAGDAAEAFIGEKRLGERIKALRLRKSMGLVELGRHTGLSASFLSQLETGRVVPTLRNLARIAIVFSKDLSYFFEPEPKTLFRVHRSHERVRLPQTGTDEPSYFFESLGYMVPDRQLDPYYIEFLPGVKPRRAHQHPGHEFLYLLEGELDVQHGNGTHTLQAGDAAYFDAGVAHSYICRGEKPAKTLLVTLQGNGSGVQHQNGNGTANGNGHRVRPTNGTPAADGQRPRAENLAKAS